jgi:hypothetical protein
MSNACPTAYRPWHLTRSDCYHCAGRSLTGSSSSIPHTCGWFLPNTKPISIITGPIDPWNKPAPLRALPEPIDADTEVIRHDRLDGLLHEYSQVA